MTFDVDVLVDYRTQKRKMKEYWVIRGISTKDGFYKCVGEKEVETPPNPIQIADYLAENPEASFCSVEHNYKFI